MTSVHDTRPHLAASGDSPAAEPGSADWGFPPEFSLGDPRQPTDVAALEGRCRAYLEQLRWPDGVRCPRCVSAETGRIEARRKFYCRDCRYQFSVTAGTIFHNSHLPLWKWFLTISLMLQSEEGVPSNQLLHLLGGSYKTAWFAQHRVRTALQQTGVAAGARPDANGTTPLARSVREAIAERLDSPHGRDTRLFDRPVVGPYHQLSVKHAAAYAMEMEWRATCRSNPAAFRDTILCLLRADPLEFAALVAGAHPLRSRFPLHATTDDDPLSQDL